MIGATRDIDAEPEYTNISKLILKAWKKPMKILKFYDCLQKRPTTFNIIVALKACITMQYYFLYGPIDAIQPYKNADIPLIVLTGVHTSWVNNCKARIEKGVVYKRKDNA